MVPLDRRQKQSVLKRIAFAEVELGDLEKFKGLSFEVYQRDRDVRRNIERLIENLVNCSTDIAKIVIAGENLELPETYKEVFERLEEAGMIGGDLARSLGDYAHLRNIRAHQYLDIKWKMVKDFVDRGGGIYQKFLQQMGERAAPTT